MTATQVRSPRWRRSFRAKWILVSGGMTTLVLGAHSIGMHQWVIADRIAWAKELHSAQAHALAEQTRARLEAVTREMAWVAAAQDPELRDGRARELLDREPTWVRLDVFEEVNAEGQPGRRAHYRQLSALDRTALEFDGLDLEPEPATRSLLAGSVAGQLLQVTNTSLPPDAALLTAVYRSGPGQIVVAELIPEALLRLFARTSMGASYLVNDRGEVLAHPDAARVVDRAEVADHPLARRALASALAPGVETLATSSGERMIGAFRQVGFGGLAVFTEVSHAEAVGAGAALVRRSYGLALAIALAALAMGLLLSRMVLVPVRKLQAAVASAAQGDGALATVASNDLFGDLARTLVALSHARERAQAQQVQSEKMAVVGQLGAGLADAIQAPLGGIVGFAQLAQRCLNNRARVQECLRLIEQEGRRSHDLLEDFLEFARPPALDLVPVEVRALLEDAVEALRPHLANDGVDLQVEIGESDLWVDGDPKALARVLGELAQNAQLAAGSEGRIRLGADATTEAVTMWVEDPGPGVPAAIQHRIFEPFFSTRAEGEGMGLAYCLGVVRAHGGRLECDPEPCRGTCFQIVLPRRESVGAAPETTVVG